MSIVEARSIYSAVGAVMTALQGNLAAVLAPHATEAGVPLPVPDTDGYHVGMSRPLVDHILMHSAQSIFVTQQRPSEILDGSEGARSGSPSTRAGMQMTYIEVSLFYANALSEAVTLFGKAATDPDIMEARGWLYAGGLVECLRKYGCNGDSVVDVQKVSDFAGAYRWSEDGLPIIGIATCVVALQQPIIISEC